MERGKQRLADGKLLSARAQEFARRHRARFCVSDLEVQLSLQLDHAASDIRLQSGAEDAGRGLFEVANLTEDGV